jgi:hypothetical protein
MPSSKKVYVLKTDFQIKIVLFLDIGSTGEGENHPNALQGF